jgi:hypothetical protein
MPFGGMCAGKRRKGEKGIAPILAEVYAQESTTPDRYRRYHKL